MTVEEIKVKFTAEIGSFKKDISSIGETLKGVEAQMMDIASSLEEITEPIKNMSQNIEALTGKLTSFSGEIKSVGKDTSTAGTAISDMVSKTQKAGEKTDKLTREYDKAVNTQNRLKNALAQYQAKLEEANSKFDISKQKIGNISGEMERQQTKIDTLKNDYEQISEVMSSLNITDSISSEMERQRNIVDKNKTAYEELYNAKKRLEGSDYQIVDVGDTYMDLEQIVNAMNKLDNESEQAWAKLEQLENALDGISEAGKSYGSVSGMQKLNTVITQQENKLRTLQNQYLTAKAGASGLEASQTSLANKLEQTKTDYQSTGDRIRQLAAAIEEAEAESKGTVWDNLKSKIKNVGNATATLIHKFQDATSKISKFGSAAAKVTTGLASGFGKTLATITMLGPAISGLKNKLSNLGQSIKQIARMATSMLISMLFMQVMNGMGETLNSFASHSRQVNSDLSALSSSFAYLKSGIMSAFQPLLGYITPILTKIVNTVADAFNKLAEFFAYLTGQTTFEKATYAQKNYSDSLDQSTQSAKELQNQLLGFDEITKLDDNDSASGSGASGNSLSSGNWTTTKVDISSGLADSIKNSDWGAVGTAISEKLSSALTGIDWNKAYENASAFGTGLAEFLNGLITPTLFGALGTTIAGSINTALSFLNSFGTTFNWANFGTSISSGINNFFKTWDAGLTSETFSNLAKGMLTSMTTAVSGVDWKTVAQKIADLIGGVDAAGIGWQLGKLGNSLANAFYTVVSNKEIWSNLGTKISDGINGFFTGMNEVDSKTGLTGWQALGNSISDSITGIADTINTALEGVDWVEVGQAIADLLESINWEDVTWDLLECAKNIVSALGDTLSGLTESDTGVVATGLATGLGVLKLNNISATAAGVALGLTGVVTTIETIENPTISNTAITTLENAISAQKLTGNPKVTLLTAIATLGFKLGNAAYYNIETVQAWADKIVETLGNAFTGKEIDMEVGGTWGTFFEKWDAVSEASGKLVPNLKEVLGVLTSIANPIAGVVLLFKNWDNVVETVKTRITTIVEKVEKVAKVATGIPTSVLTSLDVKLGGGVSKVKTWWDEKIKKPWKDHALSLKAKAATTKNEIKSLWRGITGEWKAKKTSLTLAADTAATKVKDWWKSRAGVWKAKTASFKIKAETSTEKLKESFKSAINTIIGWINTYIIGSLNKISIKIPKISVMGKTLYNGTTIGFNLNKIATFATGGFPEDGLFMANHGELVGKFSNGKTAVANNAQIVEGIESGVYRAMLAANMSGGQTSQTIKVYIGTREVTDVVIKDINNRTIQTGKNPILV